MALYEEKYRQAANYGGWYERANNAGRALTYYPYETDIEAVERPLTVKDFTFMLENTGMGTFNTERKHMAGYDCNCSCCNLLKDKRYGAECGCYVCEGMRKQGINGAGRSYPSDRPILKKGTGVRMYCYIKVESKQDTFEVRVRFDRKVDGGAASQHDGNVLVAAKSLGEAISKVEKAIEAGEIHWTPGPREDCETPKEVQGTTTILSAQQHGHVDIV